MERNNCLITQKTESMFSNNVLGFIYGVELIRSVGLTVIFNLPIKAVGCIPLLNLQLNNSNVQTRSSETYVVSRYHMVLHFIKYIHN